MSSVFSRRIAAPACALSAALFAVSACAQDTGAEEEESWDVAAPPLTTRTIPVNVTEGTWMSLDVSPDGSTIAFDLLGDIYTMPIAGGEATSVASGLPWEIQPRFSPDGSRLAFISDRAGGDNIWIMNTDGSDRRQLTDESFRLLNNPTWSPDGRYIAARKHFTTQRSLGTGEIWLYHLGGGDGVALVERPGESHQKELGEPMFTPDGSGIYYSLNTTSGGTFIYAQDSNGSLFDINRYDLDTGEIETVVSGAGGAVRPTPSPDGRTIAFVRRERARSKLYIKDLVTGEERKVYDDLDQDMQETWGVQGMYPNMDWTPDSQSLIFWAGGQIRRLNVADGSVTAIPFHVSDTRTIIDPPRPSIAVAPAEFETQMPRFANVSPDGETVVFETLGRLYVKALPNGDPQRFTRDDSDQREAFPSWSRDGRSIVYVTWDDEDLGAIHIANADGSNDRTLTAQPGHYRRPRFSTDGVSVVFEKGSGGYLTSGNWSEAPGIYIIATNGGDPRRVSRDGGAPHFGASDDRIFMTVSDGDARQLVSIDLNGEARRVHASGALTTDFEVSPTGDYLAFRDNYDAYVMPMTPGPQELDASSGGSAMPVTEASGDGARYAHWSHNGAQLNWSLGPTLFAARLDDMVPSQPAPVDEGDAPDAFEPPTDGVSLAMTFPSDTPDGVTALVGANIVTMSSNDGGVIEGGVIVIDNNRIVAIGAADDVTVPDGARVVDVAGKTIVPGFIDAHAHGPQGSDDIIPQQNWSVIAHLAMGVTTVHDPSSQASHIFVASEMQRAGLLLAPRIYSTGEVVYGAKAPGYFASIDSFDDARQHVRRLQAQGAHSIKNYNQPRRDQRQQVVAAALEADMAVVAEGASLFHMDLAMVSDGNTSIEHNLPQSMLYDDVLSFYAATEVGYTPTLVVTYGGPAGDPYWRQAEDVWLHPLLSLHVPPHVLQPGSVRRMTAPDEDFVDQQNAATAKLLADRGVLVSIGAHGQEEGLGSHWEMWSFVRGGMSPLEALRAATITPAQHLGFATDIGSLETGKLADLVILNSDPLANIRNTDDIDMVMLNGRLYDAATMNETVTGDRVRAPYYWE